MKYLSRLADVRMGDGRASLVTDFGTVAIPPNLWRAMEKLDAHIGAQWRGLAEQ